MARFSALVASCLDLIWIQPRFNLIPVVSNQRFCLNNSWFRQKLRPSSESTKLMLQIIKAIINQYQQQVWNSNCWTNSCWNNSCETIGTTQISSSEKSFPAQNGECFENVRDKSHSLDDREQGCPILSQPEGTECASQRRAIYRCDFPRIATGKTIFLHLGPPQRSSYWR